MQGNYSHSLAEYTLAACNWFAKDLPRLRAQQKAKRWEPYDVEELRCKRDTRIYLCTLTGRVMHHCGRSMNPLCLTLLLCFSATTQLYLWQRRWH